MDLSEVEEILRGVTPGPWRVDGEPWNQIVWSAADNRVCFMAHSNGLDDERDIADARFIAFARQWVPEAAAHISALTAKLELSEQYSASMDNLLRLDAETITTLRDRLARMEGARKTFPLLGGGGVGIDWQLVQEHAGQARTNHGQTLEGLARRGGLSWCELYAVLHDRRWQKMDSNEAMIACRSLEARYLAALTDGGSNG